MSSRIRREAGLVIVSDETYDAARNWHAVMLACMGQTEWSRMLAADITIYEKDHGLFPVTTPRTRCTRCGCILLPGDQAIVYTSPTSGKVAACASHVFPGGNCVVRQLTVEDMA